MKYTTDMLISYANALRDYGASLTDSHDVVDKDVGEQIVKATDVIIEGLEERKYAERN